MILPKLKTSLFQCMWVNPIDHSHKDLSQDNKVDIYTITAGSSQSIMSSVLWIGREIFVWPVKLPETTPLSRQAANA
jgi:hypothetical protein